MKTRQKRFKNTQIAVKILFETKKKKKKYHEKTFNKQNNR